MPGKKPGLQMRRRRVACQHEPVATNHLGDVRFLVTLLKGPTGEVLTQGANEVVERRSARIGSTSVNSVMVWPCSLVFFLKKIFGIRERNLSCAFEEEGAGPSEEGPAWPYAYALRFRGNRRRC